MKLILSALFLLNPVFGTLGTSIYILTSKVRNSSSSQYMLYFFLACTLGFINMTKIPENDLAYHASFYLQAKNYSLANYLKVQNKEILFYSFDYIFYYLSGGSVKYWIFVITVIPYFLFFISVHKFQLLVNSKRDYILFAIVIAAFFPQLFSLSAHLIRQFIAGALLIYFLVDKLMYGNNKWWIALAGILIHSSTIILFPLAYLKFLNHFPTRKNFKYHLALWVILLSYQILAKTLLPAVSDISSLNYALTRASKDTTFKLATFSLSNYIFIGFLLIVIWKYVYMSKKTEHIKGLIHIVNIILILTGFILVNIDQLELSNRLFFYLCFFFPLIIPLAFSEKMHALPRQIMSYVIMIFFFYRLSFGVWTYDSIDKILTSSSFYYITKKEFII